MRNNYEEYKNLIEEYLLDYIPAVDSVSKTLKESMEYSLLAGGKRLRPVLLLAACDFAGGRIEEVLPFACGLEFIHTYSLIHDDLPAMDDDDLRRGKPSNHKAFNEGIAILAGDGLLNSAFEIMSKNMMMYFDKPEEVIKRVKAMHCIAKAAGVQGMIGGQTADLENEGKEISDTTLEYIHINKTSALISAALLAGLYLGTADSHCVNVFRVYGENLGLAFQIADDILDVEGTTQELGKETGSDESNQKITYVTKFGIKKAQEKLKFHTNKAKRIIEEYYDNGEFFRNLADELAKREK